MKSYKFLFLLVLFIPLSCFARENILISTDTANSLVSTTDASRVYDTDDGIAILDLSNQKQFKIAALIVQFGNTDRNRQHRVAVHLMKLKGLYNPI